MAEKALTLEEVTASNTKLTATVNEQAAAIKDLNKKLAEKDQKINELESDVEVSAGVVEELKAKIVSLETKEKDEGTSKTIHKLGKKKYRLLYAISFNGSEITDEVLAGNEKLLAAIVGSGSGAVQEVQ